MYDNQVNIVKQKIEKLAKEAKLKHIPKLKISKKERIANASLRKEIIMGEELLAHWQRGEIDENDIESTLAHEIGHIIDLERRFHSVYFRYNAIAIPYVFLWLTLPKIGLYLQSPEPWLPPVLIFIVMSFFLPWILRKSYLSSEFEADRNASHIIGDEQLANSIVRKSIRLSRFCLVEGSGLTKTWEVLMQRIRAPSLDERLRNINFEIREEKIEIQRIKR